MLFCMMTTIWYMIKLARDGNISPPTVSYTIKFIGILFNPHICMKAVKVKAANKKQ